MTDRLYLTLDGFEGPLDLLLDLARTQKVDLARISILQLAEQYLTVVEEARRDAHHRSLELAADWLVMAAWLAWLKSRLLLPDTQEGQEAEEAVGLLQERLIELERMRKAAAWLAGRDRLGVTVFGRGAAEDHVTIDRSALTGDLPGLVSAYLAARRRTGRRAYVPRVVLRYWSVQEALSRLKDMLGDATLPAWRSLKALLPDSLEQDPRARPAAVAGALLAGLEMAKSGALELRQDQAFGEIEWRGRT